MLRKLKCDSYNILFGTSILKNSDNQKISEKFKELNIALDVIFIKIPDFESINDIIEYINEINQPDYKIFDVISCKYYFKFKLYENLSLITNKSYIIYVIEVFHIIDPYLLQNVNLTFDRDEILALVKKDGLALIIASDNLKRDREVVLAAVSSRGMALEFALGNFRQDREVVLAAVSSKGMALQFASLELKQDRDVVLAAVSSQGMALQFASLELKGDKNIVLSAIIQNPESFHHASEELKRNKDVVLLIIRKIPMLLQFV